jgi:hypothetical protein
LSDTNGPVAVAVAHDALDDFEDLDGVFVKRAVEDEKRG